MDLSRIEAPSTVGGYVPLVDLPCERRLGEFVSWIVVLAVHPATCKFVPWMCCPIRLPQNTTKSVTHTVDCDSSEAFIGAWIMWFTTALSITGIMTSFFTLIFCAAQEAGVINLPEDDNIKIPFPIPGFMLKPLLQYEESDLNLLGPQDLAELLQPPEIPNYPLQLKRWYRRTKQQIVDGLRDYIRRMVLNARNTTLSGREVTSNNLEDDGMRESSRKRRKRNASLFDLSTSLSFYEGNDEESDNCERDEVLFPDGDCHELLRKGPCDDDEVVLMDPTSKLGYCAPRLCSPDKVFLFSDQSCHDLFENDICPPGRQLFTSSFGTPVCGCPDGSYEEDDDFEDDTCKPILSHTSRCSDNEIFWFRSFRRPPECVPDPCKGLNLKRDSGDPPFLPSLTNGKCFQIGENPSICHSDTWYSVAFDKLRGICSTIEDAGYLVLDPDDLAELRSLYGDLLPKISTPPIERSISSVGPAKSGIGVPPSLHLPLVIGQSVLENKIRDSRNLVAYRPTHVNAYSPHLIAMQEGPGSIFDSFLNSQSTHILGKRDAGHSRQKRNIRPFASPGNVIEPSLAACRAGAKRDLNSKCRDTVLPARFPHPRVRRTTPPVSPKPTCRSGFYNLRRQCVSSSEEVENSLLSVGLG